MRRRYNGRGKFVCMSKESGQYWGEKGSVRCSVCVCVRMPGQRGAMGE